MSLTLMGKKGMNALVALKALAHSILKGFGQPSGSEMLALTLRPILGSVVDRLMLPGSSMLVTRMLTWAVSSVVGSDSVEPEASSPSVTLTVSE